jgi:hypothetical protein
MRPFNRRDVPIEQCACPEGEIPCYLEADGEDRLCDECRRGHDPDNI